VRPGDDLHITESSATGGGGLLAGRSDSLSGRVAKQRNFAPDGEGTQYISRWALGRSVTIGTGTLWPLIERQK